MNYRSGNQRNNKKFRHLKRNQGQVQQKAQQKQQLQAEEPLQPENQLPPNQELPEEDENLLWLIQPPHLKLAILSEMINL